jgi:hypothetical protein
MSKRGNPFLIFSVLFAAIKGAFTTSTHHDNTRQNVSNGRDGFLGVSAPRCHNQKKRYKGFAK